MLIGLGGWGSGVHVRGDEVQHGVVDDLPGDLLLKPWPTGGEESSSVRPVPFCSFSLTTFSPLPFVWRESTSSHTGDR